MYAVIETGGKQYKVADGDVLEIERLDADVGGTVSFEAALVARDEGGVEVGIPRVDGATVEAEVLEHPRGRKVVVFKMKRRKSYRRKRGHRQELTRIRISGVNLGTGGTTAKKGKDAVEKVADKVEKGVEKTGKTVEKKVEKTEKVVEKTIDEATEKAERAVDKAAEKVENTVKKAAKQAKKAIDETVGEEKKDKPADAEKK